jgi:hypothetical protein
MKKNSSKYYIEKIKRARKSQTPKLLCGMAKCINAEAIPELQKGRMYFIQEIPNMPGHVVVLSHLELPIVGIDSDRFLMYDGDNDSPYSD